MPLNEKVLGIKYFPDLFLVVVCLLNMISDKQIRCDS